MDLTEQGKLRFQIPPASGSAASNMTKYLSDVQGIQVFFLRSYNCLASRIKTLELENVLNSVMHKMATESPNLTENGYWCQSIY